MTFSPSVVTFIFGPWWGLAYVFTLPIAADIGLTTVHQDHIAKGAHAARMLLDPTSARAITLPTRLVIRGSTAPPGAQHR